MKESCQTGQHGIMSLASNLHPDLLLALTELSESNIFNSKTSSGS